MQSVDENEEEAPLDPAAERLRKKLTRLLVVSISIMMIGLMAVLGAIVYRLSGEESDNGVASANVATSQLMAESRLKLPDGAEILSVSLDGARVLLHLRMDEGQSLLVYDLEHGNTLARVALD